jgi:hypothetical protein
MSLYDLIWARNTETCSNIQQGESLRLVAYYSRRPDLLVTNQNAGDVNQQATLFQASSSWKRQHINTDNSRGLRSEDMYSVLRDVNPTIENEVWP